MFFAMTNAIFDAGIVAWTAKRTYDSVRPVTAIDFLFQGQQIMAWGGSYRGTVMEDGSHWIPYQPSTFPTPPFPEYISGHSTFSAAGAEILKRFTHSDNSQSGTQSFSAQRLSGRCSGRCSQLFRRERPRSGVHREFRSHDRPAFGFFS